jgi:Na+/phosphate symporter
MGDEVLVTLISTMGGVMIAGFTLIGTFLSRQNKHAAAPKKSVEETKTLAEESREQVTNAHTSNFREEVTEGFNEIRTMFEATNEKLDKQGNSLKAAHGKINRVDNAIHELTASDKAQWHRLDKLDPKDDFLGGSNND